MADLPTIDAALEVAVTGQTSSGVRQNPVNASTWGLQVDPSGVKSPVEVNDGSGNPITSDTDPNGTGNQLLHTTTPDSYITAGTLGALNASVTLELSGLTSVGFQLNAGTLIGTITGECSLDGGTTWVTTSVFITAAYNSITFSASNTLTVGSILVIGGSSHARITVTSYTSGSATCLLRASQVSGQINTNGTAAFGTVTNNTVSVSKNTATLLLAANPLRKYAYISNGSGSSLTIQFGNSTGLTSSTGLYVGGQNFYELAGDNLFTGAIYGYSGGNITVSVTEGTP